MENKFEKVVAATSRLANAFIDVCVTLIDYLTPAIKLLAAAGEAAQIVILARKCPNRRVAHIALHGKKHRIRKKNIKRLKEYAKGGAAV